ncbi:S-adenosyl-L-methionine-dependent methyltransferase [Tuber brumale]|nr:S-adenosyl-L-methionine-dependent methyltransferase [Tuber brumale]
MIKRYLPFSRPPSLKLPPPRTAPTPSRYFKSTVAHAPPLAWSKMSAPPPAPPGPSNARPQRRQHDGSSPRNQKRRRLQRAPKPVKEGGAEEVLQTDISSLMSTPGPTRPETLHPEQDLPPIFSEIELTIKMLSSTGDGLAENSGRIYVAPFSIPGDIVTANVIRHTTTHSTADFLSVKSPSQDRDDSLIGCKYFNTCSGCIGDPLTPHFDGPRRGGFKAGDPIPDIGFMIKGRRQVLDIEDCPTGTDILRKEIKTARSTTRRLRGEGEEGNTEWVEEKECITDNNAQTTEYIGDYKFVNLAGAFFQNNNSILPAVLLTTSPDGTRTTTSTPPKYLVDAYCGSGLFTILCGKDLTSVIGVDMAADSVAYASSNTSANNIQNARFISGNAETIFESIDFPGTETSVIIDPPRKGCDKLFLDQLLEFKPKRVVYVSCDVHTQARDLGYILSGEGRVAILTRVGGEGIVSLPDEVNDK